LRWRRASTFCKAPLKKSTSRVFSAKSFPEELDIVDPAFSHAQRRPASERLRCAGGLQQNQRGVPARLRTLALLCYQTGARLGEATGIFWAQVDLTNKRIPLTEGQAKSGKARVLPLTDELVSPLEVIPNKEPWWYAFPAKNMRKKWIQATNKAKCEGLLFHDLGRSAVRNMMRAGVQRAVAMEISGHTSPHIFQRYNIVDEAGLHEAVKKVEEHKS
jgi:integrase